MACIIEVGGKVTETREQEKKHSRAFVTCNRSTENRNKLLHNMYTNLKE